MKPRLHLGILIRVTYLSFKSNVILYFNKILEQTFFLDQFLQKLFLFRLTAEELQCKIQIIFLETPIFYSFFYTFQWSLLVFILQQESRMAYGTADQEVETRAKSIMCPNSAPYLQLPKWQMESVVCISAYHFFSFSVEKRLIL